MSRDDRRFSSQYPVVFSSLVLLCLAAVWALRLVSAISKGTLDWPLFWLALLGLFLVWQFFIFARIVKAKRRAYSQEKCTAMSLLAEYLGGEMPEWVTCAYKHSAFAHKMYPRLESEWKNLSELVGFDLDRYDPRKNIFLGLILLDDEILRELPLGPFHKSSRAEEQSLARASRVKELDSLITAHLTDDLKQLYPKEIYYLRVNFLRDYMSWHDSSMYDNEEADDWYLRHGYDLPEERPILRFCRHILQHPDGPHPAGFDEKELRNRFAGVHEEYFPNGMRRVGGSWLRPRPWYAVEQPLFTFTPLTETEEAVLERIANDAHGLWTFTFDRYVLGSTDEEVDRALKTIKKFWGCLPPEHNKSYTEVEGGRNVFVPARYLHISRNVAGDWREYKRLKGVIACPECHKLGLRKKGEDRVRCPHCQYEFWREKEQAAEEQEESLGR
jgi:hypothetical protein